MGNNKRLKRIERLIQKEINKVFQIQTRKIGQPTILSVTHIHVDSNLSLAKVFISIYPPEKSTEIIQKIQHNKVALRYDLGKRIGKRIKHVPDLFFLIDDSLEYIRKIDQLLSFN